jgi:purine-binding chemotaxis protein CheW
MDFLEIRRKAKERAERAERAAPARAADPEPGAAPPAGAPPPAEVPAVRGEEPVLTEADLLEGALAARLQGLPAPVPAAPSPGAGGEDGPRFLTWRPGEDPPPIDGPIVREPPPEPGPERREPALLAAAPAAARPLPAAAPPPAAAPARVRPPDPLTEFFYDPGEEAPLLDVAPADAPAEEAAAPAVREEFLTFRLGDEEYAVAIGAVREVLRCPPVTEVPRAPAHVTGVVTVRGEVVAAIDPRRRLGLPAPEGGPPASARMVIVDAGEGPCGLLVDAVASVVRLAPGSIEPCPTGLGGAAADCLAGIGRERDRLFTLLDLAALLRRGGRGEGDAHGA